MMLQPSFSAQATAAAFLAACVFPPAATLAAPPGDAITHLPGYGRPPTPMFSGYLDAADGCAAVNGPACQLHYWLALADDEHYRGAPGHAVGAPRPTLLWLNGGPGSSSLYGFLQELGPLLLNATGGLMENPWAWTKANVHVLALESPMGVGFSYCSRMVDAGQPCVNTDTSTAHANRAALVDFFARKFPELRAGGLFLAGESYAGVYVPTLARELLTDAAAREHVPLRGVLVGDPCTDGTAQAQSMNPLWYAHKYGLVDDEVFAALQTPTCADHLSQATRHLTRTAANPRPLAPGRARGTHSSRPWRAGGRRGSARVAAAELNAELLAIADPRERRARAEGLYGERVLGAAAGDARGDAGGAVGGAEAGDAREDAGDAAGGACRLAYRKFLLSSSHGLSQGWHDLYIDDYSLFAPVTSQEDEQLAAYLNREDVRKALHVEEAGPWLMDSGANFSYTKEYNACNWRPDIKFPNTTMVDVYREILPSLERVWIYNGDADPCVSYEGTREAVKQILAPELDGGSYRPWFYRQAAAPPGLLAAKAPLFGPGLLARTLDRAQFAGEVTSYAGGLAFATFHGSGHMVPQFRPQSALHFLQRFLDADGTAGAELAPLLPPNATLAALSEDAFDAAMDAWTEKAQAVAGAPHSVSSARRDADRSIQDCTEACFLEPPGSRDSVSFGVSASPQRAVPVWLEEVLTANTQHTETATVRRHPLHFLLVAGGVVLGMVISHLVAKHSAPRRLAAASPPSSFQATEATPLRNAGA